MTELKFLDLFAGIGGFRSGLEKAGHKCVGYVEIDEFARKSYQAIYDTKGEYTEHDIRKIDTTKLPEADIWTFGFPCQDISVAGKQKGFAGERSSLFFAVTGKLRQLKDEQKPSYLLIENVKNLLSINGGRDFGKLQIELDEIGYDVEWDVLDTAEVLPQHRERVYIVGHFRGRRTRSVFPITGKSGSIDSPKQKIIRVFDGRNTGTYGSQDVVSPDGIAGTLNTMGGGNREPKIAIREATKQGYMNAVAGDSVNFTQPNSNTRRGRVDSQRANTLETSLSQGVVVPVITPDRVTKKQNGRRMKTDGEPMYTLNATDVHGVLTAKPEFGRMGQQAVDTVNEQGAKPGDTVNPYYKKVDSSGATPTLTTRPEGFKTAILPVTEQLRIRKLTPRECWRLQGFEDWQYDRAEKVNSKSQLYKQAGNSVSVPVVELIAEKL